MFGSRTARYDGLIWGIKILTSARQGHFTRDFTIFMANISPAGSIITNAFFQVRIVIRVIRSPLFRVLHSHRLFEMQLYTRVSLYILYVYRIKNSMKNL